MNNGAFGENFPYSNFHDLNMDWIIKIAKDFLDQYTHIQEVITNGEQSLTDLTADGIEQLQTKKTELENLLQQWYDTHSEDIANELATAVNQFTIQANAVAQEILDSLPSDYTELAQQVSNIYSTDLLSLNRLNYNGDGLALNSTRGEIVCIL